MKKMIHGGDIYRHPDMIDFSSNCNPFGPPQSVQDAICRAAGQIGHYPDVQCSLLRDALSAKLHVPGAWIFFGNGAAEVIFAAVTALKPKKALLPAPTFAEYAQALETVGCEIQYVQTAEADGFALPMDFAEQITEDIDMVFLCNPNNPTGNLLSREETERVIRRAGALDCTVVLDECFLDLVEKPDEFSMLGELAMYPHVILLKAFTKLYAMAGAHLKQSGDHRKAGTQRAAMECFFARAGGRSRGTRRGRLCKRKPHDAARGAGISFASAGEAGMPHLCFAGKLYFFSWRDNPRRKAACGWIFGAGLQQLRGSWQGLLSCRGTAA